MNTNKLLAYYPRRLPVSVPQWDVFQARIIDIAGPMADADSMAFVIATNIINSSPERDRMPDILFVKHLRKAAAKQIASYVFQDIKAKQDTARRQAAQQAEVTAPPETVTSDEKKD